MHTLSKGERVLLKTIMNPHCHVYRIIDFHTLLKEMLKSAGKIKSFDEQAITLLHIKNFNNINKNPIYEAITASLFVFSVLVTLLREIEILEERKTPQLLENIATGMVDTMLKNMTYSIDVSSLKRYLIESILSSLESQIRSEVPKQFLRQMALHHQMECGAIFGEMKGRGLEAAKYLHDSSPIIKAIRGEELFIFTVMLPLIQSVKTLHRGMKLDMSSEACNLYRKESNKAFNVYFIRLVGAGDYFKYPGISLTLILKITLPFLITSIAYMAWRRVKIDKEFKIAGDIIELIVGLKIFCPIIFRHLATSWGEFRSSLQDKLQIEKKALHDNVARCQEMQVVMPTYGPLQQDIKTPVYTKPFTIEFRHVDATGPGRRKNSSGKLPPVKRRVPSKRALEGNSMASSSEGKHKSSVTARYVRTRNGQYIKFPTDLNSLWVTRGEPHESIRAITSISKSPSLDVHKVNPPIVRKVYNERLSLDFKLKRKGRDNTSGRVFVSKSDEKITDDSGKNHDVYTARCYSPNGGHKNR